MTPRKTKEQFIIEAQEKHKDKNGEPLYDYSEVEYENNNTNVKIGCKVYGHGYFNQAPSNHLSGKGCLKCAVIRRSNKQRSTKEEFIIKAKEVHKDDNREPLYDYSKVEYSDCKTDVIIICKDHGEFKQRPNNHLNGSGCQKCGGSCKKENEDFIKEAQEKHKDENREPLYDYSQVEYTNAKTDVIIICKVDGHGEFKQNANAHLKGSGCPKCALIIRADKRRSTTEEFIIKAIEIHKNENGEPLYDYSKVNYIDAKINIIIDCKKHGEFEQWPTNHLSGKGCPKCSFIKIADSIRLSTEEFRLRSKEKHKDKDGNPIYSYDKSEYSLIDEPIIITCNTHGDFNQKPHHHLRGQGCPKCSKGKQFSNVSIEWLNHCAKIYNIYILHGLNEGEFKIPKSNYKADGYCKETNTIYEFNGCYFHGCPHCFPERDEENRLVKKTYDELYESTLKKKKWCEDNGYNFVEIWECEWTK
jgi:hypothetical protein